MIEHPITIKIIVDNNAADGFVAEHGFSVYVDNGLDHIIFDCGQGSAFKSNIKKLDIDLSGVSKLVISHGHYDHTGAVKDILCASRNIKFYAHPDIFENRYSIHNGGDPKNISVNSTQLQSVKDLPEQKIILDIVPTKISNNVFITGEISRSNNFEDTGGPFYLDKEKNVADLIYDDQSLCIETTKGIVLITGCCHSGIVNTMDQVKNYFDQNIYMVIGGLHLIHANNERINKTINAFSQYGVEKIIPCHCTGENAVKLMQRNLGNVVEPGYAGMEIKL